MNLTPLERLEAIDRLLRDESIRATQEEIAKRLGVSDRTIRGDFEKLKNLGAPIVLKGSLTCSGFCYAKSWDLWRGLKKHSSQKVDRFLSP